MTIEIKIEGKQELFKAINDLKKTNEDGLDQLLFGAANKTRTEAIRSIQKHASSGITYKRGTIEHTASLPGFAPNSDTGNLVNNITVVKEKKLSYTVGSRRGAPYGRILEFGSRFMLRRPWLVPAFRLGVDWLQKKIDEVKNNGR